MFIILICQSNNNKCKELEKLAFENTLIKGRNLQKFIIDTTEILKTKKDNAYSIWYGDIKVFKYVNDIFGRDTGDNLLKYWSDYLKQDLKEGEVFGRLNADIFVALRT